MKRILLSVLLVLIATIVATAQNVTLSAHDRPAAEVFRQLMEQTGKNFVYSSDLLDGVRVSVDVRRRPLKRVLRDMFDGTDIEFRIKGNQVLLMHRKRQVRPEVSRRPIVRPAAEAGQPEMLDEVMVVSRLESPAVSTVEVGAKKLTAGEIASTPALLGEADVIKALQLQPGISEDTEGMAGMHVHGGGSDENLYMLDNVPLYQVNHFAGLFSAFNVDAIRYIDFFKSSIPARYDGRLSSFLDVRTISGSSDGHHGSAKLGLTSGAFNISGPIGSRTTYSVALRRSWYDVLTVPILALINSGSDDEKIRFQYAFMDLNAKVTHRLSDRTSASVSVYFGDDILRTGDKNKNKGDWSNAYDDRYDFHWGNLVAQANLLHRISPSLSAEFTAAYTRYFSNLKKDESETVMAYGERTSYVRSLVKTSNNIDDWIARADFNWQPSEVNRLRFGAGYTLHSFLPQRTFRENTVDNTTLTSRDPVTRYPASEFNLYAEDEWHISPKLLANVGLHASLFHIDSKNRYGLSPRLSLSYRISDAWAIKGAYSRTTQYVHQLTQSYLALPTDQWVPVTGDFKPQTADKVAIGAYWQSRDGRFAASVEGYWKEMHHLLDYRDEYYLHPPMDMWTTRLTSGSGRARGLDFKIEKTAGRFTGHLAYSLGWSDRRFADRNGGRPYPARFDNRHSIKLLLNWQVSRKVDINVAWTGHSGNRFTFMPQSWDMPGYGWVYGGDYVPLETPVNNYQLPFYHRLDLGLTVRNSRGYWNFGLYNAYCNMNAVAISRDWKELRVYGPDGYPIYESKPVFRKLSLLPIIPSISYTWQF